MTSPPRKYGAKTRPSPPAGKRFSSGNPGKPKGARNRVSVAVEALLEGEAEALTRKAIEAALGGDMTALRLCMDRIAPAPKERAIHFTMPPINGGADVPAALASVIGAVARGELLPGEGVSMATIIDRYRSAYELEALERRVTALEGGDDAEVK